MDGNLLESGNAEGRKALRDGTLMDFPASAYTENVEEMFSQEALLKFNHASEGTLSVGDVVDGRRLFLRNVEDGGKVMLGDLVMEGKKLLLNFGSYS